MTEWTWAHSFIAYAAMVVSFITGAWAGYKAGRQRERDEQVERRWRERRDREVRG